MMHQGVMSDAGTMNQAMSGAQSAVMPGSAVPGTVPPSGISSAVPGTMPPGVMPPGLDMSTSVAWPRQPQWRRLRQVGARRLRSAKHRPKMPAPSWSIA